ETKNEAETLALAQAVGRLMEAGDWIALMGGWAATKTVFVKGLAAALTWRTPTSPTFAIVQTHRSKRGRDAPPRGPLSVLFNPALEWEELTRTRGRHRRGVGGKANSLWPSQAMPVRISRRAGRVAPLSFSSTDPGPKRSSRPSKRLT
ncbi:MAG: tRNA (adenosine(37)-N6)-threonylcarbamoyltransferase complex ATPase subunit type 1 TsaE, partial [Elusimicrobia bacterium]|nr:tRNA (adenosine(37)-N6)-threonylcarbamoyltransferase complex ATPase subunit type 1 TsaE [Elusimicrobiota bacterium]